MEGIQYLTLYSQKKKWREICIGQGAHSCNQFGGALLGIDFIMALTSSKASVYRLALITSMNW